MEFITWLKLHSNSLNVESNSNAALTKVTSDSADKTNANAEEVKSEDTEYPVSKQLKKIWKN